MTNKSVEPFNTLPYFGTSIPSSGVPKYVGVIKDYTDLFVTYAFVWFYKLIF